MAQLNFNAANVQPDTGVQDPIPAGWYAVMIDQSEMKPTKDGTGAYLELRFSVMEGQYANRKVFGRLNLRNNNATTQEIAYKQLSAICHAVGQLQVNDSQELHGKPMKIKVKVRPATADYEASNDISAFKNINDPSANSAPAAGAPQGFQQPAMGGAPAQQPWQQPGQPAAAPMQAMGQPVQQMQAAPMQQQMQPAQQPWQQPAQSAQPQQQYQQQPQQQMQQQAPVQQAQQPWQQPDAAAAQPWAQAPQGGQQMPQQQPMQQQQPVQQQQQMQANPAVQQYAGAVPPWQQQQ